METLRAISLRRTIRNFKLKPIPENILFKILEAGNKAPRAGNINSLRFILVVDPDMKKKVAKAAAKQMWIANAPVLVIMCSVTSEIKRIFGKRGTELYSIQNTAIAAQNMILAATGLNVGSAFVSAFAEKTLKTLLKIPDSIDVHAIIALGYPERMPALTPKMALGNIVYYNEWDNKIKEGDIFPIGEKLKKVLKRK